MCDLLLDLVVARLKHNPVPEYMLFNVLKMVRMFCQTADVIHVSGLNAVSSVITFI